MLPDALPYHLKVRDYFRGHTSIWEFFAVARVREEQLTASGTDLLKNTYPLSREADPGIFEMIDRARAALELTDLPVAAYRADAGPGNERSGKEGTGSEWNAGAIYLNREVHLVLTGPVLEKPDEGEWWAAIVKALARIRLYILWNGEWEITNRIVRAIANHPQSDPVCLETARRFSLYSEIYCDRCVYTIVGDINAVSAVEGVPDFERLDLLDQQELKELTYDFLQEYLRPEWMRTKAITSLQQQYFPYDETRAGRPPEQMAAVLAGMHPDIRTYFGYLLLDFALADPSLEEALAGRAREFAREMQLSEVYETIRKKELSND